jgi:tRNA (guanine-N7-)-methyltransferase
MEQRRIELLGQLTRILPLNARFVWELGCGHGHFLTAYAQANPDALCVGIDIVKDRIDRATRKRDRARLQNLFFVRADAHLFLSTLPAGSLFSQLFMLFPDPWPKVRHHKHRVLQTEFLTAAARRAATDSQLCFRTDYGPYYKQASSLVRLHPDWRIMDEPWPFEFETVFQRRAAGYESFIARRIAGKHPS